MGVVRRVVSGVARGVVSPIISCHRIFNMLICNQDSTIFTTVFCFNTSLKFRSISSKLFKAWLEHGVHLFRSYGKAPRCTPAEICPLWLVLVAICWTTTGGIIYFKPQQFMLSFMQDKFHMLIWIPSIYVCVSCEAWRWKFYSERPFLKLFWCKLYDSFPRCQNNRAQHDISYVKLGFQ